MSRQREHGRHESLPEPRDPRSLEVLCQTEDRGPRIEASSILARLTHDPRPAQLSPSTGSAHTAYPRPFTRTPEVSHKMRKREDATDRRHPSRSQRGNFRWFRKKSSRGTARGVSSAGEGSGATEPALPMLQVTAGRPACREQASAQD